MPSPWLCPSSVTQFTDSEYHIPWLNVDDNFTDIRLIRTVKDLLHIPNPLINDFRMTTYFLVIKDFNWVGIPDTITGIEASINIRRTGRIMDDTISLYNGSAIGENKADKIMDNSKTYGGSSDLWSLETLSPSDLDENFGLVLRYQSHIDFPHRTTPNLEHVQIRIW